MNYPTCADRIAEHPKSRETKQFPDCLYASIIPNSRFNEWVTRHNAAVDEYKECRNRITYKTTNRVQSERRILALADGIAQFCSTLETGEGFDWFVAEHVVGPMVDAFQDALNMDLGRLDGGTLSGWAEDIRFTYAKGVGA